MAVVQKQALIAEKVRLFKQIGELGVQKIATNFTGRLGGNVKVANLSSGMLRISTLAEETVDSENAAVGVCVKITGPISGHAAFLVPYNEALSLVDAMMGQPIGTRKRLNELSTSALQEIARLVVSAQLSALEETSGCRLQNEPITMTVDMAYRIVSSIAAESGHTDEEAIVAATQFERDDWSMGALLLFIPDAGVVDRLLASVMQGR